MENISVGLKNEIEELVTQETSAANIGSGALDVYSTPSMIALMEKTAMLSVSPALQNNETTVGGAVNVRHYRPTAIGKTVTCKSKISSVTGKKIDFEVEVFEGDQLIGNGQHTRFIVEKDSFMEKM